MKKDHEKTTSTKSEQSRSSEVYEYIKKRSEEIQKGVKHPVPIVASEKR